MPVDITEPFSSMFARTKAEKPAVEREHNAVVNERYDLSNRPAAGVTMDRTKPVQEGVRVKLRAGTTWDSLAGMTPEQFAIGIYSRRASSRCRTPSNRKAAWCSLNS